MTFNKKALVALLAAAISSSVMAQVPAVMPADGAPDYLAKDNEPSLREAIRKQGMLTMKKLDVELMKADQELVPKENPNAGLSKLLEQQKMEREAQAMADAEERRARELSLLSVYGMEGKMFAEIQIGGLSGMRVTVSQGEKLPTGETVKGISPDSIVVGHGKGKGGKKLWVSSSAAQGAYASYGQSTGSLTSFSSGINLPSSKSEVVEPPRFLPPGGKIGGFLPNK